MPNAKERADAFLPHINKYMEQYCITTPSRIRHFLATIAVESGELKYTRENLNYSAEGLLRTFPKYFSKTNASSYARNPEKIANRVYADRMGNGNELSGDGWRYRGRGLIQLTGKSNYIKFGYSKCVDVLETFAGATESACKFFALNCLTKADADDAVAVRKAVNGGSNGIVQYKEYLRRAKLVIK